MKYMHNMYHCHYTTIKLIHCILYITFETHTILQVCIQGKHPLFSTNNNWFVSHTSLHLLNCWSWPLSNIRVYIVRLWKKEEALFCKTPREFFQTLDADQSIRLKDIGNDKFKNDEYIDAIELYTKALDVCPPAHRMKKATSDVYKW